MKPSLASLFAAIGPAFGVSAQSLLADIGPGAITFGTQFLSNPLFVDGNRAFFAAGLGKTELHVTDGTAAGTYLVREIDPTSNSSLPANFTRLSNGTILFFARDTQTVGYELFRTDGTAAGTVLVRDIQPGQSNGVSSSGLCVALGSVAVFAANDGVTGSRLWVTDGTTAGTSLLANVIPSSISAPTPGVALLANRAVFSAGDAAGDFEPWVTDGTAAGTQRLGDLNATGSSSATGFTTLGNVVLFAANDGVSGVELWRTDGTPAGTVRVADLSATGSSSPSGFTVVGNQCFFAATDGTTGRELWVTDGTNTTLVSDIRVGANSSSPGRLANVGGTLMFFADNGTQGREPWKSDGTAAGTQMITDLTPGSASTTTSVLAYTTAATTSQYVFAAAVGSGLELWATDGTAAGTVLVQEIAPGPASSSPQQLTPFAGGILFTADDGSGRELWRSNLTPGSTAIVRDLTPSLPRSAGVRNWIELNGKLVFNADDSVVGNELWASDGSPGGTQLVMDINPAAGVGSAPGPFIRLGNRVLFRATDSAGTELWSSDGTAAGTQRVLDIEPGSASSSPAHFVEFQGSVFFSATQAGATTLWRTDGTPAGTASVGGPSIVPASPRPIVPLGNQLLIVAEDTLWRSNGTSGGTVQVDPANPVATDWAAQNIVNGNTLYFLGTRGTQQDLWRTDGTAAGTVHVRNILTNSTVFSGSTAQFAVQGGRVFLSIYDQLTAPGTGTELWVSDGTAAGTGIVRDIRPGSAGSSPSPLVSTPDTLVFIANDGMHGRELWRSDGTAAGTTMIVDLAPGSDGAALSAPFCTRAGAGTRVLCAARTAASGREMWVTDGTAAGTVQLFDLQPGVGDGIPGVVMPAPIRVGDQWYFIGDNGTSGAEIFVVSNAVVEAADFLAFGLGCPGTNGAVPRILGTGVPALGRAFAFALTNAAPSSLAVSVLSFARQDIPLGGGCSVYPLLPAVTNLVVTTAGGEATYGITVPNDPTFLGLAVFGQWAVVDPAGAFAGLSFSDALRVEIGRS